jgi:hypothetical protein
MSGQVSRESDKFVLRLPDGMRDRIKLAAEANNRSMNSEILERLETSFGADIFESVMFGGSGGSAAQELGRTMIANRIKQLIDILALEDLSDVRNLAISPPLHKR